MMHTLFPSNTAIAVLDTNVFRGMGHEEPSWLATFERMSKSGYAFSISDLAFGEFGFQFTSGQVDLKTFNKAIELAERFIYVEAPLFPSKTDIMGMIGSKITKRPYDSVEVSLASMKAWAALKALAHLDDKEKENQAKMFLEAITFERDDWKNFFATKAGDPDIQSPNYLQRQFTDIDRDACDAPIPSTRFDFKVRHLFRKCLHFQDPKTPYDPMNERNKNDGPDDDLLHYLAVPAFVLTVDSGILAATKDIKSFQSNWIMRPQDFATGWEAGTLPPLIWPAIDPNVAPPPTA